MRGALAIIIIMLAACGHPRPPRHHETPDEVPVTGTATFAGTWVTSDDMDWGYRMVIVADGRLSVVVDRGRMGTCQQRGRLVASADATSFKLTLTQDTCSPTGPGGGSLPVTIPSYTGGSLTLAYKVGATQTRRVYKRDPKVKLPE